MHYYTKACYYRPFALLAEHINQSEMTLQRAEGVMTMFFCCALVKCHVGSVGGVLNDSTFYKQPAVMVSNVHINTWLVLRFPLKLIIMQADDC